MLTKAKEFESNFYIGLVKVSDTKTGWSVKYSFKIDFEKDLELLEQIKSFFEDRGSIYKHKTRDTCLFEVSSLEPIFSYYSTLW